MLHSSIRLIETFGLVQTMQSLLSVVKKWFCVNITVFLLSMIPWEKYEIISFVKSIIWASSPKRNVGKLK